MASGSDLFQMKQNNQTMFAARSSLHPVSKDDLDPIDGLLLTDMVQMVQAAFCF